MTGWRYVGTQLAIPHWEHSTWDSARDCWWVSAVLWPERIGDCCEPDQVVEAEERGGEADGLGGVT